MKNSIFAASIFALCITLGGCCCSGYGYNNGYVEPYTGPAYSYFPSHYYYVNGGCYNRCCNGC